MKYIVDHTSELILVFGTIVGAIIGVLLSAVINWLSKFGRIKIFMNKSIIIYRKNDRLILF